MRTLRDETEYQLVDFMDSVQLPQEYREMIEDQIESGYLDGMQANKYMSMTREELMNYLDYSM